MTSKGPQIDDLIRELLERRAAAGSADGLLEDILREVAAERDRPRRLSFLPASWRAVPLYVAALLVLLTGALVIVPRFPGPAAPASPSPLPSITVLPIGGVDLAPGRYRTRVFEPPLELTVAELRWEAIVDLHRLVWLRARFEGSQPDEISDLSIVSIANVYADSCVENLARNEPWPPTSGPAAFIDWLEANLGVDLGPRTPVSVAVGSGLQVEFVAPSLPGCSTVIVPISDVGLELGWQEPFAMNPAGTLTRYAVLRVSDRTLVVETRTSNPARRDALWAAADGIVASIATAPSK
jgi:hypothetical protein